MITKNKAVFDFLSDLIHNLGGPAHLKGHNQLRIAILMAYEDPDLLGNMMKGLYASVAKECHTTTSRVERNIRAEIDSIWDRGDTDKLYELFKNTINSKRGKAPNREFIMMIVDILHREFD